MVSHICEVSQNTDGSYHVSSEGLHFLGNSSFPENVKLGCPTMSMENFTILGVPGGPQSISPNGLH